MTRMEDWLNIPKDRKSHRPKRLVLLIGMVSLLFVMIIARSGWT
jgi:hypothetical protein